MLYLDAIVTEVHHSQGEAMPDASYPRDAVVAHVESLKSRGEISPIQRLHPAENVVADVQVPESRHRRQHRGV